MASLRFVECIAVFSLSIFFLCGKTNHSQGNPSGEEPSGSGDNPIMKTSFTLEDFYSEDEGLSSKVDSIFNSLSDRERVSQMIISSGGNNGKSPGEVEKLISDKVIGGVIFLGGSKEEFTYTIENLNGISGTTGALPLIFSTDAEPSLINRKISGLPEFPDTKQIETVAYAEEIAGEICIELNEIGINQNYAPVCDYGFNTEIISKRAFGGDVKGVGKLAAAFLKTTQKNGIVATAKHFPGHGNVKGDSHNKLVYIDGEMEELDIFKEAIDAGVISVMMGHIAVKNNEKYNTSGYPSSLSPEIIHGLLREELGFKGVVITDGMNMGALKKIQDASLGAVYAGCDLILMEPNERRLHKQIMGDIAGDEELREQVYESVKRIIRMKVCLGLI